MSDSSLFGDWPITGNTNAEWFFGNWPIAQAGQTFAVSLTISARVSAVAVGSISTQLRLSLGSIERELQGGAATILGRCAPSVLSAIRRDQVGSVLLRLASGSRAGASPSSMIAGASRVSIADVVTIAERIQGAVAAALRTAMRGNQSSSTSEILAEDMAVVLSAASVMAARMLPIVTSSIGLRERISSTTSRSSAHGFHFGAGVTESARSGATVALACTLLEALSVADHDRGVLSAVLTARLQAAALELLRASKTDTVTIRTSGAVSAIAAAAVSALQRVGVGAGDLRALREVLAAAVTAVTGARVLERAIAAETAALAVASGASAKESTAATMGTATPIALRGGAALEDAAQGAEAARGLGIGAGDHQGLQATLQTAIVAPIAPAILRALADSGAAAILLAGTLSTRELAVETLRIAQTVGLRGGVTLDDQAVVALLDRVGVGVRSIEELRDVFATQALTITAAERVGTRPNTSSAHAIALAGVESIRELLGAAVLAGLEVEHQVGDVERQGAASILAPLRIAHRTRVLSELEGVLSTLRATIGAAPGVRTRPNVSNAYALTLGEQLGTRAVLRDLGLDRLLLEVDGGLAAAEGPASVAGVLAVRIREAVDAHVESALESALELGIEPKHEAAFKGALEAMLLLEMQAELEQAALTYPPIGKILCIASTLIGAPTLAAPARATASLADPSEAVSILAGLTDAVSILAERTRYVASLADVRVQVVETVGTLSGVSCGAPILFEATNRVSKLDALGRHVPSLAGVDDTVSNLQSIERRSGSLSDTQVLC